MDHLRKHSQLVPTVQRGEGYPYADKSWQKVRGGGGGAKDGARQKKTSSKEKHL